MKLNFTGASVLVVGDIILDQYYYGNVSRISPEAPVPVVKIVRSAWNLGGAGYVANNIAHLKSRCFLIGLAGNDDNRRILENLLKHEEINYEIIEALYPTTTKVRVIGERQQMIRLDFEKTPGQIPQTDEAMMDLVKVKIAKYINDANVIIISDYGKGFFTPDLCRYLINIANRDNKITIVDPKGSNWDKYKNATVITPNVKELSEAAGRLVQNIDTEVEKSGIELLNKYNFKNILVTRSDKGMSFINTSETHHIPTDAIEVFDVSGAGDTVVAALAVCVSIGMNWIESVKIANRAAGIVVSKSGTVPININELEDSFVEKENAKILNLELLHNKLVYLRKMDKKIVFTNGCFDILHRGHINYLRKAKDLGDILIIGLNSDQSVRRLKGEKRPFNKLEDRAEILSCLEFVDFVTVFDEDTPYNLIKSVRPDILVKGGDYKAEEVVGREFASETVILPFLEGYSTTDIIRKKESE